MLKVTRTRNRPRFFAVRIPQPGPPWLVASSTGVNFTCTTNVKSSVGTDYSVLATVLASNGTTYNPV